MLCSRPGSGPPRVTTRLALELTSVGGSSDRQGVLSCAGGCRYLQLTPTQSTSLISFFK